MEQSPKSAVELQEIVDQFNKQFNKWTKDHGARAIFGWTYGDGKDRQVKGLEIQAIDIIVWRKPPPKGLGEMMDASANNRAPTESAL